MPDNSAKPKLSKKKIQNNALNDNRINPPRKTFSIYRNLWSRNYNNINTMQQGNSKDSDINRLEKKIDDLAERIDNGFLNFQAFLENLFSRYFSKSSEDQKIPRNKANISYE